jgi:hypothetical protein
MPPGPAQLGRSDTLVSSLTSGNPSSSIYTHQPGQSFSSIDAFAFGVSMGTLDSESTIRSRMPDPFFNQSEMSRRPSDAYEPTRRQVNRASELSSLSSGFGDGGDILVPESATVKTSRMSQLRSATNLPTPGGRFSWQSQGKRETVYTEASEDWPPRFRSVNSWVSQQAGRIRRQQSKDDAPPVPALPGQLGIPAVANAPPEQSYNLMMADGEVPRPVQEVIEKR